ncbi:hypothetical protein SmJEL517_g03705 [Synchytrium microbalum]|uniref:Striatin N-terminal domain-containing protein n=1 Tax=Synchytrium microbalum TaxID=1806994 RepID=A0A507BVD6_9FUNG|nr:uncharacterized protein SmJEL517_g03705 [Synchytrium microbalum]TPX33370.1 hypothetical protein SmJEL517_g03705 [Synchytrium microbalum]
MSGFQQQQQQQPGATTMPSQGYTLPGVLHFLQLEWRRFERDRNDWEIEKSDLKSKIAFLESERRGMDNMKTDLLRRIKMLEYALRQERNKYSTMHANNTAQGAETPSEPAMSPEPGAAPLTTDHRDIPPDTGTLDRGDPMASRQNTMGPGQGGTLLHFSKGVGHMRTREILKNYLREAGQLTSPSLAAGLPLRSHEDDMSAPQSSADTTSRREMPPQTNSPLPPQHQQQSMPDRNNNKPVESRPPPPRPATNGVSEPVPTTDLGDLDGTPPSPSPSETFSDSLSRQNTVKRVGRTADLGADQEVPSVEEVQEKLKLPNDGKTQKMMNKWAAKPPVQRSADDPLASLSLSEEDTEDSTTKKSAGSKDLTSTEVIWRPKGTLRSHMDAVRAVAMHPTVLAALSGSEDHTAKLWNLQDYMGTKKPPQDLEPIFTYRGHTGPITSVAFGPGSTPERCFTASMDSTIREWIIPNLIRDVYAPYDSKLKVNTYVGHSDAVWDVRSQPSLSQSSILASCSADGTIKLWNTSDSSRGLRTTLWYGGAKVNGTAGSSDHHSPITTPSLSDSPNPTSIDWIPSNLTRLIAAYQNSTAKVFDITTGSEILSLKSAESYDGTPGTQINKIICHSTMSLAFTAHEDKCIRIFDLNSGLCIHSMIAHLDSVTSLDIHPLGLSLVSGGHDCSMRFWDLSSRNCMQEYSSHRRKGNEGMWSVKFHPTLHDTLISGGADSTVKLYRHGSVA